ncbi:catecholate siderophore receptor CirA [Serratia rubidaea]|uniref:Catecholate siderophore receptor CirA n=1 Tax=Serratia rubidaea TaxID=61652 RepID=A0A3S4GF80_SERRU|nr:catecholate siderophore receptor CirA [Serratia rubidaea]
MKPISGNTCAAAVALLPVLWPAIAGAAPAADDEATVVVTAKRSGLSELSTPAAVSVVNGEQLRDAKPQVNLSESLGVVPGLQVQNRQNYAQDLQLSVRGFGARSTYGVRGVRIYVDGIPATMPDGQGKPRISIWRRRIKLKCCADRFPRCMATPRAGWSTLKRRPAVSRTA